MGPSRLLETDTFGCFDLLIKDWTRVKPPFQPGMKNKTYVSADWEKKVLPRRLIGLLQSKGLFGLLLVSIAG